MRVRTLPYRGILLVAALAMPAAYAQETAAKPPDPAALKLLSLEELSKIEITTTSKESAPAFRTPAAIFVLTEVDIRRSGATNIPDLLRLAPGVEVAQIDSAKWAIGIRGFQGRLSKSVLVLIDGRSVYTPLFAGVYWEMQDTMIEDIDRIEVIRGPGATVWGANAVNGVINIITKSAKDTRGTRVTAGGGNVEQGFVNARHGGGNDRLSYRVYGRGFTRGPQFHPGGRNFDDWRRVQGGFRLDGSRGTRDSFSLLGNAYRTVAGTELTITGYSPPYAVIRDANGTFSGQNVVGTWRRSLSGRSDVQVRGFYDRTDRNDLNYREVRHTFDMDAIHHVRAAAHNLIWGGGVRISPSRYTQTVPTVDFQPHKQTYSIYSAFAQDTISFAQDRLNFTLGAKFEHNSFSGFEYQPSGRLAWTPNDRHTLWAAITRAVRTPARTEEGFAFTALLDPAAPAFLRLIGDAQFKPEQLVGYELGYRTFSPKAGLIVSVNGFYNRYNDILSIEPGAIAVESDPAPAHVLLPIYFRNGLTVETGGVEVASLWDARSWWRINGSYSLMRLNATRRPGSKDPGTSAQLEGSSPRHKIVAGSSLMLPHAVELSLVYRHVSGLPSPDVRVAPYSTGDVRIARRFSRELELSVNARNLMQPSHFEYSGNPGGLVGIRRSAFLQLTWIPAGK
jgi:iron complex outermembrane recepter protein